MRYSGGIIHWIKEDLYSIDVLTRKQLTLHRVFHLKGDVDHLYVLHTLGGKALVSIKYAMPLHSLLEFLPVATSHNSDVKSTFESIEKISRHLEAVKENINNQKNNIQQLSVVKISN